MDFSSEEADEFSKFYILSDFLRHYSYLSCTRENRAILATLLNNKVRATTIKTLTLTIAGGVAPAI